MRILVVEDERKVAGFLKHGLEEEKYIVDLATDGDTGYDLAINNQYDAIILDLMLPGKDGLTILGDMRSKGIETPVIILTARGSLDDKISGLDIGADDYIAKPFSFDELTARLRSVLRRSHPEKSTKLKCGDLTLDTVAHIAIIEEREIELTTKEYSLLEYLMRNKNRVLSRTNISQHVWKQIFDPDSNIIDVYIKRLRTKIDNEEKQMIQSIRGVGYRLKEV